MSPYRKALIIVASEPNPRTLTSMLCDADSAQYRHQHTLEGLQSTGAQFDLDSLPF